ncbi:CotH kinase family protein, partial [Bradyrhizobium guangdongense]|uniref:CotH kinase family protein n=1 Tax=Bradyrhizobium guangdongense TaxID=1325090 RepID=UPI001642A18D
MNRFFRDIPEFRIEIEPEFIRSMNAGIPAEQCSKIRFKKVPLKRLVIDGTEVGGKTWIRYRGFCADHWSSRQRSVKINIEGQSFHGYRTFNLNALAADPSLFDIWATDLLRRAGGVAPKMSLARFYINGEYDGVRELLENLDGELLAEHGLPRGEVYREITWAFLGHAPKQPFDVGFRPYADVEELKESWKKNARKGRSWQQFLSYHNAVFDSVVHDREDWREVVNYDHYLNYYAVVAITGTQHLNNHNIPVYVPAGTTRAVPIGYDFGLAYASTLGVNHPVDPDFQPLVLTQNWLGSLFWSDERTRSLLHARIVELLKTLRPAEAYERIIDRGRDVFGDDISHGLYLKDFASSDHWAQAFKASGKVRERISFLSEKYLRPTAKINPDWKGADAFQFLIDGLGMYDVSLVVPDRACSADQPGQITVEVNGGA